MFRGNAADLADGAGLPESVNYKNPAEVRDFCDDLQGCENLAYSWRMGRDSNPRRACTLNGFQDRRNRPLCHPSETLYQNILSYFF